jgi:hypothetical protein
MDSYEEMMNDPDRKQYLLLQEQLEFWKQRYEDDELTPEQKDRAAKKYQEYMEKSIEALQKFNRRWESREGPLPPMDDEMLKYLRNQFANIGQEITPEELRQLLLEEDDDEDLTIHSEE